MENSTEINCKEIFRKAYENRYTWNKDFNGYKGKCGLLINNNFHEGTFQISKDFKPNIKNIDEEKIVKIIASQLFEVCIHRVKREFKSVHSENCFKLLKNSECGIDMIVSGKNEEAKVEIRVRRAPGFDQPARRRLAFASVRLLDDHVAQHEEQVQYGNECG